MALHYQTEYRLGNRGRIRRSYSGFQAFIAIAFDLVFGLLFELVFAVVGLAMRAAVLIIHLVVQVIRLYWRLMIAAMTLTVYVITLPFVWIHQAVDRLRSGGQHGPARDGWSSTPPTKPSWALSREV